MQVRQSSLAKFGSCARQYYYSEVAGLGSGQKVGSLTVFGSVWHYAVDVYETYGHNLELGKKTFKHYWAKPGLLGLRIDFWHNRTSYEQLAKRGVEMLNRYHDLAPWRDDGRLIGTEVHFVVPIGTHMLEGTIDKLWVREGAKVVQTIDFKTGRLVPEKLRENVQFTAYSYATTRPEFWEQVGKPEMYEQCLDYRRQGFWYHARDGKMFNAGFRELNDYGRLLLAIDQMDRAIDAGVFPLDISGVSCGWCEFSGNVCGSEAQSEVYLTIGEKSGKET